MRRRTKTDKLTNLKMNDEVYALRRKVIGFIYEAKALFPALPRIEVRVTEDDPRILGLATLGGCVIWITERMTCNREVVFHEIVHAAFGFRHDEKCPLMSSACDLNKPEMPKEQVEKLFLKYARKWKEMNL